MTCTCWGRMHYVWRYLLLILERWRRHIRQACAHFTDKDFGEAHYASDLSHAKDKGLDPSMALIKRRAGEIAQNWKRRSSVNPHERCPSKPCSVCFLWRYYFKQVLWQSTSWLILLSSSSPPTEREGKNMHRWTLVGDGNHKRIESQAALRKATFEGDDYAVVINSLISLPVSSPMVRLRDIKRFMLVATFESSAIVFLNKYKNSHSRAPQRNRNFVIR